MTTDSMVTIDDTTRLSSQICGGALGPDWAINRSMKGAASVCIDSQMCH